MKLKFSLVVLECINHKVIRKFCIESKIAADDVNTRSSNSHFFIFLEDQLVPVFNLHGSSHPGSFGTKMFLVKLSVRTFTDQVHNYFGYLVVRGSI